ncbi:MAG: hypothetical protein KDA53_07080 [Hyphomonas sp.]|nr:hypothetical protein [Hyphomonas sp.]
MLRAIIIGVAGLVFLMGCQKQVEQSGADNEPAGTAEPVVEPVASKADAGPPPDRQMRYTFCAGDGDCGFLSETGEVIISGAHDVLIAGDYAVFSKDDGPEIVDLSGREILPNDFDVVRPELGLFRVVTGNLQGVVNPDGDWVIPQQSQTLRVINISEDGPAKHGFLASRGEQKALYDIDGRELFSIAGDYLESLGDGRFIVGQGNSFGLIDTTGTHLIRSTPGWLHHYTEDLFVKEVPDRSSRQLVEMDGSIVSGPYETLFFAQGGYGIGKIGEELYLLSAEGDVIISGKFKAINVTPDGKAFYYSLDGDWFLQRFGQEEAHKVDGNSVSIFSLNDCDDPCTGAVERVVVRRGNREMLANYDGGLVSGTGFENFSWADYRRGLFVVERDGAEGVVDASARMIVPAIFDSVLIGDAHFEAYFLGRVYPVRLDGTPIGFDFSDVAKAREDFAREQNDAFTLICEGKSSFPIDPDGSTHEFNLTIEGNAFYLFGLRMLGAGFTVANGSDRYPTALVEFNKESTQFDSVKYSNDTIILGKFMDGTIVLNRATGQYKIGDQTEGTCRKSAVLRPLPEQRF